MTDKTPELDGAIKNILWDFSEDCEDWGGNDTSKTFWEIRQDYTKKLMKLIQAHTTKEQLKMLDRLESQRLLFSVGSTSGVLLSTIEAERELLGETNE